jgi:pteridine reductase
LPLAFVTGAGQRIGQGLAQGLLAAGYHLILHANKSIDELLSWVNRHELANNVTHVIKADLSNEDGVKTLVNSIKEKASSLDLIIHNASQYYPTPFNEVTNHQLTEMLAVNLMAPYFITQGLLDLLRNSPSPCVINIVDAMWHRPRIFFSHYAVSKAALAMLTRSLAVELAPHIRVNAISPGAIMFSKFETNKSKEELTQKIPQKKTGQPQDI